MTPITPATPAWPTDRSSRDPERTSPAPWDAWGCTLVGPCEQCPQRTGWARTPCSLSPPLPAGAVEGPPEDLARQGTGVLAAFQQHLAIDQHVLDADRLSFDAHTAVRQVIHGLPWLWGNGLGV